MVYLRIIKMKKEGEDRVENLEQLVNAATQFMAEEGFAIDAPALLGPKVAATTTTIGNGIEIIDADAALNTVMSPLSAFLSHASLEAGDNQAQVGQDALQLMTVHAAKGLEFDSVFISGLEEGLFPHENSIKEDSEVEEERRLMYVAITRARQRLYICFAQSRMLHGQIRYNVRSRFLDELPETSTKWLTAKVQSHWFATPKSAWDDAPSSQADNLIAQKITKNSGTSWRIGQSVAHAKFGEGVIINIEGSGNNARAHINFGSFGMKLLDLSIAKLDKLS